MSNLDSLEIGSLSLSVDSRSKPRTTGFGENLALESLRVVRTIGTGTLSRVYLVADADERRFFALKVMNKQDVVRLKQISHVNSEREILESLDFPYLVKLHKAFHDSRCIYLLLDFIAGGEMFTHLRRAGRFAVERVRFYAAEVALALEYLHSKSIIYRDLKPENVLFKADGHVCLTDFGLSKRVETKTWTLCGTPEYIAPEIILSRGHDMAVDWWALGILIYEMLVGFPPFYDPNPFTIYEKIIGGKIWFPNFVTPAAKSLILGLLSPDRTCRLGNMKDAALDIKRHPFFEGLDWERLERRDLSPPIDFPVSAPGDPFYYEKYPEVEFVQGPEDDPFGHLFEGF